jgi:hypothetical protein
MNQERRLVPRYELALPMLVGEVRGLTRNLSLEGVLFLSPAQFAGGEAIRVTIFVSAGATGSVMRLEGLGAVVRSDPENGQFITAVRFDELRVLTDATIDSIPTTIAAS